MKLLLLFAALALAGLATGEPSIRAQATVSDAGSAALIKPPGGRTEPTRGDVGTALGAGQSDPAHPTPWPARLLYLVRWWALGSAVVLVALWGRQQRPWQARAASAALVLTGLSFVFGRTL